MSYNIDTWKTKELNSFKIPIQLIHVDDELNVRLLSDDKIEVSGYSEGFVIVGHYDGDNVNVEEITNYGEGSGWSWKRMKELLSKSTGKLVSIQIWECGDSITKLTIENGKITEEPVEL